MTEETTRTAAPEGTVWPCLRYHDPRSAVDFLTGVAGFTEALVVPDEEGATIVHAELRWPEGGAVMLGDTKLADGDCARLPAGTSSVYVVTERVDEIYRRVKDSGARISQDLNDTDYGSHTFTMADFEGNMWTFGTYRGA
ncbi:VOC family protein [Amycolatopsis nigrescens]|uniref:VOC family protein n=1 Tax=Amycolatopsis nigrescens TaxID=381445 RepID=UPI00035E8ECC|nr:VOC family protein [Amycolatopsis nigrescens]